MKVQFLLHVTQWTLHNRDCSVNVTQKYITYLFKLIHAVTFRSMPFLCTKSDHVNIIYLYLYIPKEKGKYCM